MRRRTFVAGYLLRVTVAALLVGLFLAMGSPRVFATVDESVFLSPCALAATKDGKALFIACATANRVLCLDLATRCIRSDFLMPGSPSGLALAAEDSKLFVTCAGPASKVCIVDLEQGKMVGELQAGHTATAPVVSRDGKTLFVCNRFNNDLSVFDLRSHKELRRIPVQREPVAAALTPDGRTLLVANALPAGRANARVVAAVVSVIDAADGRVFKELTLPDGSSSLKDLRISPDGKHAVVTHVLSRYHLPAEQVERGWMNVNALTLIDLDQLKGLNTVLLDEVKRGAANPWGLGWSSDSKTLAVTHAGTHEVSSIDFPALLAKLKSLPATLDTPRPADYGPSARVQSDVPNDLTFLTGLCQRIKLPANDRGPRAVAVVGQTVYVANYFSDTLCTIDLAESNPRASSIPLGPSTEMTSIRRGELFFHDATICLQGWQSCSSCHPGGARMDGLNWDLMNDGVGNPKNTKSLLLAHQTPPAMSMGVRDTAETAVRAGIQHILFTSQSEAVSRSIDAYLKSLRPLPSPYLVNGKLSTPAQRGEKVFERAGCAKCHPAGLFTNFEAYEVGTRGRFDQAGDKFDTPALVELWRTAPYLHDGSAATVREVITTRNPKDQHGRTSDLTSQEIEDLCAYLLSL